MSTTSIATTSSTDDFYVYVSYPRTPDIKFDTEYYKNKHMALVDKYWRAYGLKSWTVVQFHEGDLSGVHTQAILCWGSEEQFDRAWDSLKDTPELSDDFKNYTNVLPVQWKGVAIKRG